MTREPGMVKSRPKPTHWQIRGRSLPLGPCPLIMGIINVTPDSFSDGGNFSTVEAAIERADTLVKAGADIIDIGGQSTRPGSERISPQRELERVQPAVEAIVSRFDIAVSVDTYYSPVAFNALGSGAHIINDVSACRYNEDMARIVAETGAGIVLMHMLGTPMTMQNSPFYKDVLAEVCTFLIERAEFCRKAGIRPNAIAIDPGIGFGKTFEHNLALIRGLDELSTIGMPVLLGHSRKSFFGRITGTEPAQRDLETAVLSAIVAQRHAVDIIRVHDVDATKRAIKVAGKVN
ncbi:MAG: dihydropteroate synthase [Planctomycetota bacterium]|nr:dihydropteroate synthase [Planctomycetota bacterium]